MMDIVRQQMSYKCFRIEGSKICNSDFYSNASISSTHASSNGQYSCPFIFSNKQKDLGLLAVQRDHNYRRISSRCSQQGSRFPAASSDRLKKMEVGLQSFSNNMQEIGASRRRSFCIRNFPSGSNIHVMEVGSIQHGKEGFSNNMDPSKRICFLSFCINKRSLEQSAKRKSDFVANHSSLANSIMVSTTVTTHSENAITSAKNSEPLLGPKRESVP